MHCSHLAAAGAVGASAGPGSLMPGAPGFLPTPLPRCAHPTGRAPDVLHLGSAPLVGGSIPSATAAPSGGPPPDVLHDLSLDPR